MTRRYPIEVPLDQEVGSVPIEGYAPFFFPPEGARLSFEFNEESFLQVLSALVNGAAYTYPDNWLQVVWYFLQNVEYPVSLCDQIAECISTNPATQQAIIDMLMASDQFNNYIDGQVRRLTQGQITGILVNGECDLPVIAGRALTLVNRMDANNLDFLEIVEEATNDEERFADVLEAIPVLDELPIGDIIQFSQDILEDFAEGYAASSTEERRSDLAQGIYCIMLSNTDCAITFEELFIYMNSKMPTGLDILSTTLDVLNFVRTGDFSSPDLVFNAMFILQTAFVLVGRNFGGINLPAMAGMMLDAAPSDIYLTWDECGPPPGPCTVTSTWPDPITTFYQGTITNRTGDVYTIDMIADPDNPGFYVFRSSNIFIPDFSKGPMRITNIEVVGTDPGTFYMQDEFGVAYSGSAATIAAYIPGCIRYIQWSRNSGQSDFQVKLTIET